MISNPFDQATLIFGVDPMHTQPDSHGRKQTRTQFDKTELELGTALAMNNWVMLLLLAQAGSPRRVCCNAEMTGPGGHYSTVGYRITWSPVS